MFSCHNFSISYLLRSFLIISIGFVLNKSVKMIFNAFSILLVLLCLVPRNLSEFDLNRAESVEHESVTDHQPNPGLLRIKEEGYFVDATSLHHEDKDESMHAIELPARRRREGKGRRAGRRNAKLKAEPRGRERMILSVSSAEKREKRTVNREKTSERKAVARKRTRTRTRTRKAAACLES